MWHLELSLFIAACAVFFLGATEPVWRKPKVAFSAVHLVSLGALLFTLVWTIQLAQA
jgi:hypothetical protein